MGREGEVTERSHSLHANFVTGPGGRLSWLQLPLPWACRSSPSSARFLRVLSSLQGKTSTRAPREVKQGQDWNLSSSWGWGEETETPGGLSVFPYYQQGQGPEGLFAKQISHYRTSNSLLGYSNHSSHLRKRGRG